MAALRQQNRGKLGVEKSAPVLVGTKDLTACLLEKKKEIF